MKTYSLLFLCLGLFQTESAGAVTISHSGQETEYQFQATVRSTDRSSVRPDGYNIAKFHSEHVFGVFHSPEYAAKFGFPSDLNEGFIGAKYPTVQVQKVFRTPGDDYWSVTYTAKGEALVLKKVLQQWGRVGTSYEVELPMLTNLPAIYRDDLEDYSNKAWKDCSDPEYPKSDDFSYFYDPFRCPELGRSPIGDKIRFRFTLAATYPESFPDFELKGDNGNGQLTTLYFALGFDGTLKSGTSKARIRRDEGFHVFKTLVESLQDDFGFFEVKSEAELASALGEGRRDLKLESPVSMDNYIQRRFYRTFVKQNEGVTYVARVGLFDSQNQSSSRPLRSFPTFWREAWANGDFVYYGGHSGDGIALDQDRLISGLDRDDFFFGDPNKVQVGFLDGCSTYAYYQDMYKNQKPKLHLMTYGVVSLFHAADVTIHQILTELVGESVDKNWDDILLGIERAQLFPHLLFLYGQDEGTLKAKRFERQELFPSFLLNVWVP